MTTLLTAAAERPGDVPVASLLLLGAVALLALAAAAIWTIRRR
ncbi:hypothetical protein [Actinoplanes sp. DH11]|nr:hypothetical protein [Actinoplanes sp. DH11]